MRSHEKGMTGEAILGFPVITYLLFPGLTVKFKRDFLREGGRGGDLHAHSSKGDT